MHAEVDNEEGGTIYRMNYAVIMYVIMHNVRSEKTTQRIWTRMNRSVKRYILIPSVVAYGARIRDFQGAFSARTYFRYLGITMKPWTMNPTEAHINHSAYKLSTQA